MFSFIGCNKRSTAFDVVAIVVVVVVVVLVTVVVIIIILIIITIISIQTHQVFFNLRIPIYKVIIIHCSIMYFRGK